MSECEICKKSGLGDLLGSKENGEKMYHSWCMLKLMPQQSAKDAVVEAAKIAHEEGLITHARNCYHKNDRDCECARHDIVEAMSALPEGE